MENKLISMVEFVLKKFELASKQHLTIGDYCLNTGNYANFLNTSLNLGMFVPAIEVDGKWEVFTDPNNGYDFDTYNLSEALEQYQKAKENVLFEGFKIESVERLLLSCFTIEDLLDNYYRYITLTKQGMIKSGLK